MGCCGGRRRVRFGYQNSCQDSQQPQGQVPANPDETPLELLKRRLAQGEITVEEYEKLAKVLSSSRDSYVI